MSRRNSNRPASLLIRVSITTVTVLFLSFVYLGLAFGAAYILSHRDWRLALLFSSKFSWLEIRSLLRLDESMIIIYGARLAFLERVVYWLTGWHVFNDYPFLGVGLGNVGFFFVQKVPPAGWNSYEIRNVINVITSVPNIKGFWIRLLSETGILGFFVFLGWYVVIGKSARLLQRNKDNIAKIIALAGLLSLIAFIGEGFSIDSFAMPYLWVIAGLISVNSMIYRREISQNLTTPPTNPNK